LGLVLPASAIFLQACGSSARPTPTVLPPSATPPPASPTVAPVTATPVPTATIAPPTVTPTPAPQGMTSPDYAVQVFLWGSAVAERDLSLAKNAGFRWVKQSLEWRYVEPHVKGTYEFNEPDRLIDLIGKLGLKVVARVDNQ